MLLSGWRHAGCGLPRHDGAGELAQHFDVACTDDGGGDRRLHAALGQVIAGRLPQAVEFLGVGLDRNLADKFAELGGVDRFLVLVKRSTILC